MGIRELERNRAAIVQAPNYSSSNIFSTVTIAEAMDRICVVLFPQTLEEVLPCREISCQPTFTVSSAFLPNPTTHLMLDSGKCDDTRYSIVWAICTASSRKDSNRYCSCFGDLLLCHS